MSVVAQARKAPLAASVNRSAKRATSRAATARRVAVAKAREQAWDAKGASVAAGVATLGGLVSCGSAQAATEALADVAYGPAGANDNFYAALATLLFVGFPTAFLILLYVKSRFENNISGGFNTEYFEEKEGTPSAIEGKGKK